jgi:two-component system OmpR family response regulator
MRILLVEDHHDSGNALLHLLERNGYVVDWATTATEARSVIMAGHFDLLLCDLILPDGDGWQVMRDLRSKGDTPGIALSGHVFPSDRIKSIDAGFLMHVDKPVDADKLLAAIAMCAQQRTPTCSMILPNELFGQGSTAVSPSP